MTKDYKGRARTKPKPQPKRNCLFWFLAGLLLGAFLVGLLWLSLDPALIRSGKDLDDKLVPRPKIDQNQPPPVSELEQFNYGPILENLEVLVTAEEAPPPPPRPKPQPKQPPVQEQSEPMKPTVVAKPEPKLQPKPQPAKARSDAWMLQIGSFRKAADAEKLKAQLAFKGIATRIQQITINGKDTFHRVRSGPYRSQSELDAVRSKLAKNNIKSIVVKWSQ